MTKPVIPRQSRIIPAINGGAACIGGNHVYSATKPQYFTGSGFAECAASMTFMVILA